MPVATKTHQSGIFLWHRLLDRFLHCSSQRGFRGQENGTMTQHVYGSGPCRTMLGFDTVEAGAVAITSFVALLFDCFIYP